MRRRQWLLALLLGLLVLAGCGQKTTQPSPEEPTPPAAENAAPVETPEESEPAEAVPDALTAEEIARVNEAFAGTYEKDGVLYATQVSCFFTSYYRRPEDLNLTEFLWYFTPGEGVTDEAEFQALKRAEGWHFGAEIEREDMPVPISKIRREDVDACLMKYAGITTADMAGNSPPIYLEEYDAYYVFTSDFGPGMFVCQSGVREDENTVRLTGPGSELVLEQRNGTWYIVSRLPLEGEA